MCPLLKDGKKGEEGVGRSLGFIHLERFSPGEGLHWETFGNKKVRVAVEKLSRARARIVGSGKN